MTARVLQFPRARPQPRVSYPRTDIRPWPDAMHNMTIAVTASWSALWMISIAVWWGWMR